MRARNKRTGLDIASMTRPGDLTSTVLPTRWSTSKAGFVHPQLVPPSEDPLCSFREGGDGTAYYCDTGGNWCDEDGLELYGPEGGASTGGPDD